MEKPIADLIEWFEGADVPDDYLEAKQDLLEFIILRQPILDSPAISEYLKKGGTIQFLPCVATHEKPNVRFRRPKRRTKGKMK